MNRMENVCLHQLITAVKGEFLLGNPHSPVLSVSIDTRTMRTGDFYFAIKGRNFDGHDYLRQAIEKEAAGIVISRKDVDLGNPFPAFPAVIYVEDTVKALGDFAAWYRLQRDLPLIAVTGSNGKTTTKEMLAAILSQRGPTLSTAGNFNNQIGMPLTLCQLTSDHRFAVIEMGTSLPGEISRLAAIARPDVAIVTNIGNAHLESFGTTEGVFKEKKTLYDALPANGCAIINNDDSFLRRLAGELPQNVVTFGVGLESDVTAADVTMEDGKARFSLRIRGNRIDVRLPVYGEFNVPNALAAAAAAWTMGADLPLIKAGLESMTLPKMRMETRTLSNGALMINDAYNANPSSVRVSLQSFIHSFPDRAKVVVLGDMLELGDRSDELHAALGAFLAAQPFASIFLLGPRMKSAQAACPSAMHFTDKGELELAVRRVLRMGTAVLFKGSRGMRLEDVINQIASEDTMRQ